MSRTIRHIPPKFGKQHWLPAHQAAYLSWTFVRCGKSDRGDGVSSGWIEPASPTAKREAKRLARRASRRAARRLEKR